MSAGSALWVCSHANPPRLRLAHVDAGQALVHIDTAEVAMLPALAQGRSWRLRFDEEGAAFLRAHTGEPMWADDILKLTLCHGGTAPLVEGPLFVVCPGAGGQSETLAFESFRVACRANLDFEVQLLHGGRITLRCLELRCGRHGFHVMWNVLHLHRDLRLTSQRQAGRWAEHGWVRWCAWLEILGLAKAHIVNKGGSARDSHLGATMMTGDSDLEWRGVSTVALFALLLRWGHGRTERLRADGDAEKAQTLLTSFVHVWFAGLSKWTVWVSYQVQWDPPLLPHGAPEDNHKVVDVIDGFLVLGPLFAACPPQLIQAFGACFSGTFFGGSSVGIRGEEKTGLQLRFSGGFRSPGR